MPASTLELRSSRLLGLVAAATYKSALSPFIFSLPGREAYRRSSAFWVVNAIRLTMVTPPIPSTSSPMCPG